MSEWLRTAKRLFRAQAEPRQQTYNFHCACGQGFSGSRLELPQALPCPECRRTHFILPLSPYPEPQGRQPARPGLLSQRGTPTPAAASCPPAPPVASSSRRPADAPSKPAPALDIPPDEGTPVEFPPEETEGPTPSRPVPRNPGTAARPPHTRQAPVPFRGADAAHPGGQTPAAASPPGRTAKTRPELGLSPAKPQARRNWWTPVRKLLAATLVTLAVSGWWFYRAHRLAVAEQILGPRSREAAEALARGDLEQAAVEFTEMVAALELLDRREPRSLQLLQTGRETIARARLCPDSLQVLADEASAAQKGTSTSWKETFGMRFRGRWVVLDLPVRRLVSDRRRGTWELDCLLSAEGVELQLVGNLRAFDRLPLSAEAPRRVIFAAPLAELIPGDANQPTVWTVRLDGQQGFLWSSPETLETLGFPVDDETRAVLQAQSALLGVTTP